MLFRSRLHSAKNAVFINVHDKLPQLRIVRNQERLEYLLNLTAIEAKLLGRGSTQRKCHDRGPQIYQGCPSCKRRAGRNYKMRIAQTRDPFQIATCRLKGAHNTTAQHLTG